MNTRFLETLVVLSRLKSFRETAQVLHTTQAAASQRIAALEDELGVFLVDRSHRTLTLTPVGDQVVPPPPPPAPPARRGAGGAAGRAHAGAGTRAQARDAPRCAARRARAHRRDRDRGPHLAHAADPRAHAPL